jgi:hypothetical protein
MSASMSAASQSASRVTQPWVLDSGGSFHVTSDPSQLVSCQPVKDDAFVHTADGTPCYVTHLGSLCTIKFSIPDISFVPELSMSLLSVCQITNMDNFVGFIKTSCYVQDLQSKRIKLVLAVALVDLHPSTSLTPFSFRIICFLFLSVKIHLFVLFRPVASSFRSSMWFSFIYLIGQGVLGRVPVDAGFRCKGCNLGKQIQLLYPSSTTYSSGPFDLVHSGVYGVLLLSFQKVVTNIMSYLLMITLDILGSIL